MSATHPDKKRPTKAPEGPSLRDEVLRLVEDVDKTYFRLGGKLRAIAGNAAFEAWGFETFDEYVESELGFARRKAYYLMSIHEKAETLGVTSADFVGLGWTKAKEILLYVESKKDFEKWAKRALAMSISKLQETLQADFLGKPKRTKGKDEEGNKTVTTEDGTEFHILEFALTTDQYKNVKQAIQKASVIAKSDKPGHVLDMMALDFLAHNGKTSDLGEKLAEWAERGLIEIETDESPESGIADAGNKKKGE